MFKAYPRSFRLLTITAVLFGLSACASPPTRISFPEITFDHMTPLVMGVSDVTVDDRYVPPRTNPNAEHRIPVSPQRVLNRWAADRIIANGGDATATFVILDASVIEKALDTDGNIAAIFTNEQAMRYEARVEGMLEIKSNDGLSQGETRARASRSITIPEDASINEREQALFTLIEQLTRDFDARMEHNVRKHLGAWIW